LSREAIRTKAQTPKAQTPKAQTHGGFIVS
jgi:hypothetical protein